MKESMDTNTFAIYVYNYKRRWKSQWEKITVGTYVHNHKRMVRFKYEPTPLNLCKVMTPILLRFLENDHIRMITHGKVNGSIYYLAHIYIYIIRTERLSAKLATQLNFVRIMARFLHFSV